MRNPDNPPKPFNTNAFRNRKGEPATHGERSETRRA
jgi:hypothetical protein